MRLFTGIALSGEVMERLARLLDRLRPAAQVRWSPVYNLHITTKFIGEWPEERLPDLIAVLEALPRAGSFSVSVNGLGWFPNPHAPRVLWAGVRGGEPLAALARNTDQVLARIGVAPETKPYASHLTLARIKEPAPLLPLKKAIAELESVDFGGFTASNFHLYLSKPGPSGSIYSSLAEVPLD